jgi:hypothetical protein
MKIVPIEAVAKLQGSALRLIKILGPGFAKSQFLNHFRYIFTSVCLFFTPPIFAQDDTADAEEDEIVMVPTRKPTNNNETKNWLFAGGSLIAATIAIVFVACNAGSKPPSDQQTFPQ